MLSVSLCVFVLCCILSLVFSRSGQAVSTMIQSPSFLSKPTILDLLAYALWPLAAKKKSQGDFYASVFLT